MYVPGALQASRGKQDTAGVCIPPNNGRVSNGLDNGGQGPYTITFALCCFFMFIEEHIMLHEVDSQVSFLCEP